MKPRRFNPLAFVIHWLLALGGWLLVLIPTSAQTNTVAWHTIAGGGGVSTGAVFAVRGTIGQTFVVRMTNASRALVGGFWSITATNISTNLPPSIITQPQDLTLAAGYNATFTVLADGTPPLGYQWRFNGTNISGATGTNYILNNVQSTNAGGYSVVVANLAGSVTSAVATLTVTSNVPEIGVQQPPGTDLVDGTASFDFGSVDLGGGISATFTVTNSGTGNLILTNITQDGANTSDFSVGAPSSTNLAPGASTTFTVTFTPGAPGARTAAIHIANNDSDENPFDIALTGTSTVVRDTFGYAQLPAIFAFENISGTGTRVLSNADDTSFTAPVGFSFSFYGRTYTNASFNPNGLITLGGTSTAFNNVNLTNTAPGGNFPSIAVLWDDWCTITNGNPGVDAVYYQMLGSPGDRRFIIQWNNIFGRLTSPSSVTFQALLFETNGNILCQYLDVDSGNVRTNGAQSTVGIRDTDGHLNGKNLQRSFNQPVITNGEAILFTKVPTDPSITVQPQNQTNLAGTTATFTVTATGTGPLAYQWQKNGLTLANGGKVSGATTDTLTLTHVSTSDAANYTVAVTNASGKVVSAVARLTIGLAITTQPQSQTAVVGANATFFVTATGSDPKSYQWQTNSINIPGATDTSYTATNVQLSDSGTSFTVIVTNVAGSLTSSPAILTVRNPQTYVITTNADSGVGSLRQAVLDYLPGDNSTITFAPGLSGSAIFSISQIVLDKSLNIDASMLPNGITLDGSSATRIFEVPAGQTVVLTALTIFDGYASGGGGIFNLGTLTVNQSTLFGNYAFDSDGGGGILNWGTLTVNQSTLSGNSAINGGGGGIFNVGTLTVIQSTLSGNFAFSDGGGILNSGTLALTNSIVAGNTPSDLGGNPFTVIFGDPLLAPLGNYGGPTPTMPPLTGSPAIDGCTAGTSFTTDQRGFPRVMGAFADIGAAEFGPPIILNHPLNQTVTTGDNATFTVTADGQPPLSYQWQFNGTNLSGATNDSYTRATAQVSDSGDYSVVVTNDFGSITSAVATLAVLERPCGVLRPPCLPPVNTIYHTSDSPLMYGNGVGARNLKLHRFTHCQPPPPPSGSQFHSFDANVDFEWSQDGGQSFTPGTASGSCTMRVTSIGMQGAEEVYDTEMLQLDISGGTLPLGVMLRESPSLASMGETRIEPFFGDSLISSFFDVFTEVSLDGGQTWTPAISGAARLVLVEDQLFIISQPQSQSVLTGSNATFTVSTVDCDTFHLLSYQWRFNSTNIPGAEASSYTRTNVQPAHAGDYSVIVTNSYGSVTSVVATLTVTNANPDMDGDGLPDAWELQYFGNTSADPNADADGEGMSNLREYLAGTNPTNAASFFHIISATRTNDDMRVDWTTVGGHSYVVQTVTNASGSLTTNFLDLSTAITVGGTNEGTTNYLHTGGATNRGSYYRVRLGP